MAEIKFFGEVDLNKKTGGVSSEYPAWYFDRPLDGLAEDVGRMERMLAKGVVLSTRKPNSNKNSYRRENDMKKSWNQSLSLALRTKTALPRHVRPWLMRSAVASSPAPKWTKEPSMPSRKRKG